MFLIPLFPTIAQLPPQLPTPAEIRPLPSLPKRDYRLPDQEQTSPQESLARQEIVQIQEIRPLSGSLDAIPVFNSNSPELVLTEGILLSTFPGTGMKSPSAHLNYVFKGRFDVFSHHISRARVPSELRSLVQGILVRNPTDREVTVEVLQAASYLTRPDALFVDLPSHLEDPIGNVYAGPGSRMVGDVLRNRRNGSLPLMLRIPPGENRLLMNLPIPAGKVTPTSNGRSTLMRVKSDGDVYVANMAMFAPRDARGNERMPSQLDWELFLQNATLAGPRDIAPTSPETRDRIVYGRVSGVAIGSQWQTRLTDNPKSESLTIPARGRAFAYPVSTLPNGTYGTGQIQSAKMMARYPDTAHLANGNYGIQYSLTLPLHNNTKQAQRVSIALETPLKHDRSRSEALFFVNPEPRIFFRGPVRLRYRNGDAGTLQTKFVHLVQRRGQQGEALATLELGAGDRQTVEVDIIYPPDATPPQILTVKTLE